VIFDEHQDEVDAFWAEPDPPQELKWKRPGGARAPRGDALVGDAQHAFAGDAAHVGERADDALGEAQSPPAADPAVLDEEGALAGHAVITVRSGGTLRTYQKRVT